MKDAPFSPPPVDPARLEAYLAGELTEAERLALEQELDGDDAASLLWASDLQLFDRVQQRGISNQEQEAFEEQRPMLARRLNQQLAKLGAARESGNSKDWGAALRSVYAVAAVMTIGLVGLWMWSEQPGTSRQIDLGAGSVAALPFSQPPALRGQATAEQLWEQTERYYNTGRYGRAADLLDEIQERQPTSSDAYLYAGIARLAAGDAERAVEELRRAERLAEQADLPLEAVRWYLALALGESGAKGEALARLQAIRDGDGRYAEQAAARIP